MPTQYNSVPSKALKQPTPFIVDIPEAELSAFRKLLKRSRISRPTYESLQADGKFGITHKWMTEAKEHWLNKFDWYGKIMISPKNQLLTSITGGHAKGI
jgi:microsomal epoxide hydrolase